MWLLLMHITMLQAAIRLTLPIQNGSILTVKLSRYSKTKSKGKSCFGGAFLRLYSFRRKLSLVCAGRNPQPGDYPEAACEYLLPEQDYVFITGETLIYKTLPRLLVLAKKAKVVLVGPVAPLSEVLFKFGVNVICSFVVQDPQLCDTIVRRGLLAPIFAAGERVTFSQN